jgi:outer membrane protein OmpA-like peptidoglycan-associated protein
MTAPTRFRRDGGEGGEICRDRAFFSTGWSSGIWSDEDFAAIRRRASELEDERQRMFREPCPRTVSLSEERSFFRIYFDSGDEEIRGQRDVLERAAGTIRDAGDGVHVTVIGHTDRHGTLRESLNLGAVRAIAVKRQLALRDVPDACIECRSAGFTEPRLSSDPLSDEADVMNRRVEIRIDWNGTAHAER